MRPVRKADGAPVVRGACQGAFCAIDLTPTKAQVSTISGLRKARTRPTNRGARRWRRGAPWHVPRARRGSPPIPLAAAAALATTPRPVPDKRRLPSRAPETRPRDPTPRPNNNWPHRAPFARRWRTVQPCRVRRETRGVLLETCARGTAVLLLEGLGKLGWGTATRGAAPARASSARSQKRVRDSEAGTPLAGCRGAPLSAIHAAE